jgi:polycystin 1L2
MQAFSHSVRDLANFGLIFAIVCISFVQAFYLIFNEKTGQFATLLTSIETLLQLILGKFDVLPIMKANAQLGFAFYALYNILVVLMLVNILVSILTDHYNEEKMGIEWNAEDHTLRKLCHLFDTIIQSHTPWLLFSQK